MRALAFCALAATLVASACDDENEPIGPGGNEAGTLTVDASQGWTYVAFEDGEASLVTVADPSASEAWDIGFNATAVMLNGGSAGPGGVVGSCICQNEGATDAEVMAMTPSSELSDFEAVTAASIANADWTSEALSPAIGEWFSYNPTTHVVSAAPGNVYAVRTASGDAFAKLHVIDITGATQAHAGQVTIESAFQAAAGEPFGAPDTIVLDASVGGDVLVDLETGTLVTDETWDLRLNGYTLRTNSGVSGPGSAGAFLTGESFDDVLDAGEAPSGAFSVDAYAGVFEESSWYRYDLGGNHQIWPTFDVYLIDTADGVYKVQLTGYYSATGAARHVTFRYELLD